MKSGPVLLAQGDEYKLVIEGQGNMGPLMATEGNNITGGFGWQLQLVMFMSGEAETFIIPYVTEAFICDGVTKIGDFAFVYATSLSNVKISSTVTTIGDGAFNSCAALTSVKIPVGVTTIGHFAFQECFALTSVTIPNSVTTIGDSAFEWCFVLTSVTIPNSVTTIGDYAFFNCAALTSVTIPNSVTTIGNNTFDGCSALTSVTIPNSVTTIGDSAFGFCDALTNVYLERTTADFTVGNGAFWHTVSNSKIWVRSEAIAQILTDTGAYNSTNTTIQTDYNWTAPAN